MTATTATAAQRRKNRLWKTARNVLGLLILAAVALQYRIIERHLQQQYGNRTVEEASSALTTNVTSTNIKTANFQLIATATSNRYAYAFLVAGCSEKTPSYKGFLYNIVVATQRMRDLGSTAADFVVFIQMSSSTDAKRLPADEERLLKEDMNIQVIYLPKKRSWVHECFYAVVKEKFRILQLTQYERVLFLDGDMMPLCNLDYMFELSESGTDNDIRGPQLQENIILAENREACNAGFFMLKPSLEDYNLLQQHIRRKEEKALQLPYPYWDDIEGWGQVITPPDYWKPINGSKLTRWHFHASFADQGLLYYWTKYVKKNVSIIIGDELEHWTSFGDKSAVHLSKIDRGSPFDKFSCIGKTDENRVRSAPYRDTVHFTGNQKPWEFDLSQPVNNATLSPYGWKKTLGPKWVRHVNEWRDTLIEIQARTGHSMPLLEHGHGIWAKPDDDNAQPALPKAKTHDPPAGRFSTYAAMYDHIKAMKFFQWKQYEEGSELFVA